MKNIERMAEHLLKNSSLLAYIESVLTLDVEVLPDNFDAYTAGGIFSNLCVFCDIDIGTFANQSTVKFDVPPKRYVLANCCNKCRSVLDTKKAEKIINPLKRIRHYVLSGLLPTQSRDYATNGNRAHTCIFCQMSWGTVGVWTHSIEIHKEIWIPEGTYQRIHGCVHSCETCYELSLFGLTINDKVNRAQIIEICANCKSSFTVVESLHQQRFLAGTVGQHVCPKCQVNKAGRLGKPTLLPMKCGGCGDSMELDLTHISNFSNYVNICNNCNKKDNVIPEKDILDTTESLYELSINGGEYKIYAELLNSYDESEDRWYIFIEHKDQETKNYITIYDSNGEKMYFKNPYLAMLNGASTLQKILSSKNGELI